MIGRHTGPDRIEIEDSEVSRDHAEIVHIPGFDLYRLRDLGSRNGTYLNGQRTIEAVLQPGAVIRIGSTLFVYADTEIGAGISEQALSGRGESLARAKTELLADLAAPSGVPILITGPTGAGKEVLARRIHERTGRDGPLVAINCGIFNRELLGSELFGHVKGAFSGAHAARLGAFRAAHRGTLVLDEIAEMPLDQQPALLRALQDQRIRPVGADADVEVDVRVVAATNQDLESLVERGLFRSDLYARLGGVVIHLPGLGARREEILSLFTEFLGEGAPPVAAEAAEALLLYEWPRNVRELQSAARTASLFKGVASQVDLKLLPPAIQRSAQPSERTPEASPAAESLSRKDLEEMLRMSKGNVAEVARALGLHRQQLYRLLEAHQIAAADYRPSRGAPEPEDGT